MENQRPKCSKKGHIEIDAISYCQECNKYFCNKCQNMHTELMEDHKIIKLNQKNEVFIDFCKQPNHNKNKLEFFCKDHNTLCCVACVTKVKKEGYGRHSECNICHLEDIKDEKKDMLKDNINRLEDLSNQMEKAINELKKIFEEINKSKEELKMKVQTIFTKLRTALNEKEDKLLLEIDEEFNKTYFKEALIKESEKLPNKIKKSIEKGKIIEKEWDENNLSSLINDCINIENNIQEIKNIHYNIEKSHSNKDSVIYYTTDEEEINKFIDNIQNLGDIDTCHKLYYDFKIENKNPSYTLKNHTSTVYCLCVLNDGRLVSCAADNSIIIYSKETYQPDLKIMEHTSTLLCVTILSSGILASCSCDNKIKLFNIKGKEYQVLQTFSYHQNYVWKLIELKNKNLVSCSNDSSIIFYSKDNNQYKKEYQISTDGPCTSVIQTKDNEICYSEKNSNNKICFYDFIEKKIKSSISNISKYNGEYE